MLAKLLTEIPHCQPRPGRRCADMTVTLDHRADEIKGLQRCIDDLVGLLALSASWMGRDPSHIAQTLLDALERMLAPDIVFLRLIHPSSDAPIEMARLAPGRELPADPGALGEMLDLWLDQDPRQGPSVVRRRLQERELSLVPLQIGRKSDLGLLIVASERADFPSETERVLLTVAKNQAVIALQEARLLDEQKRLAETLERRVAERAARETAILNSALDCIVTIDHEGRITEFNPSAERTFGHRREDVLGAVLGDLIVPPALRERHRQGMARYLETGHAVVLGKRLEMTALRSDGTEFPVELAITRIPGDGPPSFTVYLRDITERKQAEERLRESERELRLMVDSVPGMLATFTPRGELEFVNRGILEYFGRSLEELRSWGTDGTTHPEDNARIIEAFTRAIESGKPFEWESRARRFDGVYRWLQTRGLPLRDSDGRIVRWYNLLIDIDERKRAEEALAASERDLKLIVDTIPAMAWSARPDGSAEFLNQQYLDFVGLSSEQAQDWGWTTAVHPDDADRLAETWQRIMASEATGEAEARLRRHDGEYRWFLFRASPLRDDSGRIVKWYGTNTDIDDRKRAEEELRRAYHSFADAERLSKTGNFTADIVTGQQVWSAELYRMFEIDRGTQITVERVRSMVHPVDLPSFDAEFAWSLGGADFDLVFRIVTVSGAVKQVHSIGHLIERVAGRPLLIGAIQDVTESKNAEEALNRARSELAHVARVTTLSTLTASIAHEVNQPLSGIITNASTCLRMLDAEPPNVDGARETARRTIRDGSRASAVIARLRALFSKKEFTPESLDLNEAVREVIALALSDLQRNHITIQTDLADDLPLVTGDRVQLQQVILNLLRNALDGMADVDDRPRQLFVRSEREDGDRVRVVVRDSGVGIGDTSLDKLFEAFYTTKKGGMGIGLSVSRSIIESHHGRIWATPNEGAGATFAFALPAGSDTKV